MRQLWRKTSWAQNVLTGRIEFWNSHQIILTNHSKANSYIRKCLISMYVPPPFLNLLISSLFSMESVISGVSHYCECIWGTHTIRMARLVPYTILTHITKNFFRKFFFVLTENRTQSRQSGKPQNKGIFRPGASRSSYIFSYYSSKFCLDTLVLLLLKKLFQNLGEKKYY